jgi:hypothetical protein
MQRKYYKQHAPQLTQDRIDKLNAIGFVWSTDKKKMSFEERLEDCRNFRRLHGHLTVPPPLKAPDEEEGGLQAAYTKEEHSFRIWSRMKRDDYHKFHSGRQCRIDKQQIKKLEDVGFDFGLPSGGRGRKRKQDDTGSEAQNTSTDMGEEDIDSL